ncbi:MAG: 2'-5' RNA ligase family protein [Steroidobacteraceae bacterium]
MLRRARETQRAYGLRSRLMEAHRLHLGLQHLGNHAGVPTVLASAARRAATSLDFPAFDLCLDRVLTFAGRGRQARPLPCVMAATSDARLHRLNNALGVAMRDCGLVVQSRGFTPHVTMFYDRAVIKDCAVEPVCFRVRELVIVHTRIGTGQRYRLLGRWPLAD